MKISVKDYAVPADEKVKEAIEGLRMVKNGGDTPHGPPIAIVHCTHGTNHTGYLIAIALGMRLCHDSPPEVASRTRAPPPRAARAHTDPIAVLFRRLLGFSFTPSSHSPGALPRHPLAQLCCTA